MQQDILQLAQILARGGKHIAFTGAGISTESGIPDYRSKGGLWDRFRPVYFDEFMTSAPARAEYWRRKAELYQDLAKARPNAAHLALHRLCELGLLEAVITQNIDGLHQASGLPDNKVIELHGNTLRVRCMSCGALSTFEAAYERISAGDPAPVCECGGYLKPDTISFGQAMPETALNQAFELAGACDVFLVIGSTLLVQPAALLPRQAIQAGACLAIINLSDTPYDREADFCIRGRCGEVLPALVDSLIKDGRT